MRSREKMFELIEKYWRAANYLTLVHMYLKNNFLIQEKLKKSDIKEHFYGHWGTSPGINFIYAHLNSLISKYKCKLQLVIGPGHAGSALLSNLYLEGSLQYYYPQVGNDIGGIKNFSNIENIIDGLRAEINPFYPGTIYDGGELGYSLPVAFGSVLDRKEAITICIIGDGELETGTIAASWNCIQYLREKDGYVLPIIHMNGYRMGGKALFSQKSDDELKKIFGGLGYSVKIVNSSHEEMSASLEWALITIQNNMSALVKNYPLIILRSPKGWTAVRDEVIHIENNVNSHKHPINDPLYNIRYLEEWLISYRPGELFDEDGKIGDWIYDFLPEENLRMGRITYKANDILAPDIEEYSLKTNVCSFKNVSILEKYLVNIIGLNRNTFRIVSPDELKSNLMGELVKYPDNVMEILNENICQGWMQGYTLTGRHSLMIGYEAFMPIIGSMISQFVKYLYQKEQVEWRGHVASMNYLLTSVCWENTYSHQNPELISSLLIQKSPNINIFFPLDANTLLACIQLSIKSNDRINIIISSKQMLPQYFLWEESKEIVYKRYYIWNKEVVNPNLIIVTVGDLCINEVKHAMPMIEDLLPEAKIMLVSLLEINYLLQFQDFSNFKDMEKVPLLFVFHGYPGAIYAALSERVCRRRIYVMGYKNKSFLSANSLKKLFINECSRYHVCQNVNNILFGEGLLERERFEKINGDIKKWVKAEEKYFQ